MKNFFKTCGNSLEQYPLRWLLGYLIVSILLWTIQCSVQQNILGLDVIEALSWGGQHALGHLKHPPLSGWLAEGFSLLSRRADWGLYFACQFLMAFGAFFVYKTVRIFADELHAAASALLLYFLYYYLPSLMKFSTYFVEMALAPLAAYCFFAAAEQKKKIFWPVFGAVCGLGLLNKYSFGLQILAFLIIFFSVPEYRKQLRGLVVWTAPVMAILVFAPHGIWLMEHDFCCFTHIKYRMDDQRMWYDPFVVIGTALYPVLNAAGILQLCHLPDFRKWERQALMKKLFLSALILTMTPAVVYFVMVTSGKAVIMLWFCTTASWTGALALAAFPWKLTANCWKRLYALLILVTVIVFLATAIDLILKPRAKIHAYPQDIIKAAEGFWHEHNAGPIPVVYGACWLAGVIENYSPARPPSCEAGDYIYLQRYKALMDEKGALLIGADEDFEFFKQDFGYEILRKKLTVYFKSVSGREDDMNFYVAYYPPRSEREKKHPEKE